MTHLTDKQTAEEFHKEQRKFSIASPTMGQWSYENRGGRWFGDIRSLRACLSLLDIGSESRVNDWVEPYPVPKGHPMIRVYRKVGFDQWTIHEEQPKCYWDLSKKQPVGQAIDLGDWLDY